MCYIEVEKCVNYGENGICHKCDDGYAFEGDNRTICIEKTEFDEYYSKDNEISYYKCDNLTNNGISNCKKCEYNYNDNELKCLECKSDYILKDDQNNICYYKSDYNNDKYYEIDHYHIKTCSLEINNC